MDVNTKEKFLGIIDKAAFFFFVVLIFFLPIANAWIESSFGFIFLCFILRTILKKPSFQDIKTFFAHRVNLAFLVFYVCIGLSLFVTHSFGESFDDWFFKWGEGFLLFCFAQVFLDKKRLKFLLKVFIASVFLVCCDGLYQKIVGIDFLRLLKPIETAHFFGITASFHHYNDFAAYLAVLFFINYGLLRHARRRGPILFLVFLSLLIITNLFFTYSRGSWVAFLAVSVFLFAFFTKGKARLTPIALMGIFLVGVMSIPSVRERFFFIFQKGGDAARFQMWKSALLMFKESPLLGKGIGTFMDYLPQYTNLGHQYAHNCYLQILAETGLLGLFSFLWALGEVIVRSYRKLKREFNVVFLGIFCGLLTFLIHSFFDTHLYSLNLSILFWILIAFLAIYVRSDSSLCESETTYTMHDFLQKVKDIKAKFSDKIKAIISTSRYQSFLLFIREKIVLWCICGVALFMPLGMGPMNVFIGLSIFFWVIKKVFIEKRPFHYQRRNHRRTLFFLFILFCITLIISCITSSHPSLSLRGLGKYAKYFFLILVVSDTLDTFKKWGTVTRFLFVGLVVVSFDALFQYLSGYDILIREPLPVWLGSIKRATATYHHPNDLGLFLTATIPLFLINGFSMNKDRRQRILKLILLGVALLALFLTFSRGAALGLIVSVLIISLCLRKFLILLGLGAATALSPFVLPKGVMDWAQGVKSIWVFIFNEDRFLMFRAALNMIKDHPFFGIGLNTFYKNYSLYKVSADPLPKSSAHNAYLHLAAETGLVGFLLFVILMG
ncbi:MAG: O-antigen ligase family protein, partial [Candidatus Omnitrophota bacterium]